MLYENSKSKILFLYLNYNDLKFERPRQADSTCDVKNHLPNFL